MSETQLWCCDKCARTNIIRSKSKHVSFETHIYKKEFGIVVKEFAFLGHKLMKWFILSMVPLKNKETIFIHLNTNVFMILILEVWKKLKKFFQQFLLCIWNSNLNSRDWIEKIKNVLQNGFRFIEIVKLSIKIDSNLSNMNMCHYLNLAKPVLQRGNFRKISRKPENVKTVCSDLYNFFSFCL